jgi:hypothetical protein
MANELGTLPTNEKISGLALGAGTIRVLAQSGVAVAHTGVTTETTLASIVIPAGSMGLNGRVRVTTLWTMTNSANNKVMRGRFNHATTGTTYLTSTQTTQNTFRHQFEIINRNSQSSQCGAPGGLNAYGQTTGVLLTSAIDTSVETTIYLTGQLVNASETLTLEGYMVELIS